MARRVGEKLVDSAIDGVGNAAGLAVAGLAGAAALKMHGAAKKRASFREMMDVNPDLKEYQQENPKLFSASYSALKSMNPTYAQDPLVAGGVMRKMMEGGPAGAGNVLTQTIRPPEARQPTNVSYRQDIGPIAVRHDFGDV